MGKSKIIVIEGPNGSGKSTQVSYVKQLLQSRRHSVKVLADKNTSVMKAVVDNHLFDQMDVYQKILFYNLCRSENLKSIEDTYDFYLYDRYFPSTFVYQQIPNSSDDTAYGLHERLENYYKIKPDLIVFLEGSPVNSYNRVVERDGLERYPFVAHENICNDYLEVKKSAFKYNCVSVDCDRSVEIVSNDICGHILSLKDNN